MELVMSAKLAVTDHRVGLTHWVCVENEATTPVKYLYAELSGNSVKLVNNTSKYAKCRYVAPGTTLRLIPMYDDATTESIIKNYESLYGES